MGQGTEERNPGAEQHGNAGNDQPLDEPRLEKALNGDAAVHIQVPEASSGEFRHDGRRVPRHAFHDGREARAPAPVLSTNTGFAP